MACSLPAAHVGTAHLEGHGVRVWVLEVERLGDLLLEGPCSIQSRCALCLIHRSLRLKPSSAGSNRTDIMGARAVVWCCEDGVGNQVSQWAVPGCSACRKNRQVGGAGKQSAGARVPRAQTKVSLVKVVCVVEVIVLDVTGGSLAWMTLPEHLGT
jgi:hypothetical protein